MSLINSALSGVKNNVAGLLFELCKLREFVKTSCAFSMYKQTIWPVLDHAGFLLDLCNINEWNLGKMIG